MKASTPSPDALLPSRYLLLLPLLVALPVIVLGLRYNFDGLYGQDAYAYYDYAVGPLRQNLQALKLPPPFFWPPGYPLLVTLLSFVVGIGPLAAQTVSLVAGALTPLLTALLAYELWRGLEQKTLDESPHRSAADAKNMAIIAGLVTALTPQLWQSSAVSMSDTTALASATLGAWALARYGRTGQRLLLALASTMLAVAMLTRMVFTALALVATLYALILLLRRPRRTAIVHGALALAPALIILAPLFAIPGSPTPSSGEQAFLGHINNANWWHMRHALQSEFVTGNGILRYPMVNGLYYALAPAHRYFFTPILAPLLLPGIWRLLKWRSLPPILFLLGWPMAIYLVFIGYPAQNFRFSLAFLPPLAILVAVGLLVTFRASGRARPLLLIGAALAAAWMVYGGWTLSESFMVRKQATLATVRWVQRQIPEQAQLLTFGITLAFEQYTDLEVYDLYHQSPADLDILLKKPQPAYLLLDVGNIASQWSGHAPGKNYRRLQTDPGLTKLGARAQYALFQIGNAD